MSEPFIGQITYVGFTFAPRGWAACDGQIMSIAQNTALFSLLGTMYGGNGTTTFALPDLRGRVPIHRGQGPGLSPYTMGQMAGTENVTLTTAQMPQHVHVASPTAINTKGTTATPTAGYALARGIDGDGDPNAIPFIYAPASGTAVALAGSNTSVAGGSQPHPNLQPYTTILAAIALEGIFPSRN